MWHSPFNTLTIAIDRKRYKRMLRHRNLTAVIVQLPTIIGVKRPRPSIVGIGSAIVLFRMPFSGTGYITAYIEAIDVPTVVNALAISDSGGWHRNMAISASRLVRISDEKS